MRFGGVALLKQTIAEMIEAAIRPEAKNGVPPSAERDRAGPSVVEPASVAFLSLSRPVEEAGPGVAGCA